VIEEGLFLGRTALIERRAGRYVVRSQANLKRLLGRPYRSESELDRLMRGLAVVKGALDERNLWLAQIAAVHLRLPELPDLPARRPGSRGPVDQKRAVRNPGAWRLGSG
jgi:hypothetical protein